MLHYKWLNARDGLIFIWLIYLIEIAGKSDEHIFSMQDFFQKEMSNFSTELYRVIDKISEMNTRLIRASRM